jgi:hypothetical protein
MNIPYLEATQALIASFLTRQFAKPAAAPQLPVADSAAPVQAEVGKEVGPKPDSTPALALPAVLPPTLAADATMGAIAK